MKIEVGKRYRRRDGAVVTVNRRSNLGCWPFWVNDEHLVTESGRWLDESVDHAWDLVEEVHED